MSNILLISSSFEEISLITADSKQRSGQKLKESSHYPLGIAYLHSYLEACGNNVYSLCLNSYDYQSCLEKVIEIIKRFSPAVVGLQILTANRVSSYLLIEYIHERYPEIHLVIGGVHSTIMFRQLLEKYPFLIAVIGEGEITFSELVEELRKKEPDLVKVNGIAFNYNGSVTTTEQRQLIDNLDILPFPKHELFFNGDRSSGSIITTRGCPFSCSFCCLNSISRRKVRYRSVKNVVDEIEYMTNNFPQMTTTWIHDDSFFLDNKRVIEICEEIIKRKIKTEFICSGRMKPLSRELVRKLEQANFKKVLLGLESGDEGILKIAHKAITQKDAVNAFELFANSSIGLHAFLIVGLPGETIKTIMETANFVKKLQKIKYVNYCDGMAVLTIYPGTEVYEFARAKGMIDNDFWLSNRPTPLFTVENSQEELFHLKEILMNHVSINRLCTVAGLRAQFTMLPYIGKFLLTNKAERSILLFHFLRFIFPQAFFELLKRQYKYIRKQYRHIRSKL